MADSVGVSGNDASLASTACTASGSAGADHLAGGRGAGAGSILLVDLTARRDNSIGAQQDRAIGDEVVVGSAYADASACDANINAPPGDSSKDVLRAAAGADDLIGEAVFDHADPHPASTGMQGSLVNNAPNSETAVDDSLISIEAIRADEPGDTRSPGAADIHLSGGLG